MAIIHCLAGLINHSNNTSWACHPSRIIVCLLISIIAIINLHHTLLHGIPYIIMWNTFVRNCCKCDGDTSTRWIFSKFLWRKFSFIPQNKSRLEESEEKMMIGLTGWNWFMWQNCGRYISLTLHFLLSPLHTFFNLLCISTCIVNIFAQRRWLLTVLLKDSIRKRFVAQTVWTAQIWLVYSLTRL